MDPVQHLAALRAEGAALAEAAAGAMDRPVPPCPGWTVQDLVVHIAVVHRWATRVVETKPAQRPSRSDLVAAAPSDPDALLAWYRDGFEHLVAALEAADPAEPIWTFVGELPAAFWFRRQALETAVHRWDAEAAAGRAAPIDAALAVDGVDEFVDRWLPLGLRVAGDQAPRGSLHLHATDAEGEWWLDFGAGTVDGRRQHAKADAALRGPASSLYLWVWNRTPPAGANLEAFGDETIPAAWRHFAL